MQPEVTLKVDKYHGDVINSNLFPGLTSTIAVDLITKWGLVASTPDGEDSAGRTKLRLSTPEELVERAIITAELLVAELIKRKHIILRADEEARIANEAAQTAN